MRTACACCAITTTLGVRYMTLTHTNTNNWADSSGDITRADVKHHNGLTPFGKDVVREMNRLGMMVDISHVSDKTFWDALEVSKAPIIASHSDARALANAPRNMTDEMIVALAKKGGVVQVNFNCGFLSQRFRDELAAKSTAVAERLRQATAGKNLGELETDQLEGKIKPSSGSSRPPSPTWSRTSTTSGTLPASTRSASARISMAWNAFPKDWRTFRSFPT